MEEAVVISFALLAHVILPVGFVLLCRRMQRRRVWWFTYLAYFFVFGAFGGWFLMLEVASLGAVPLLLFPVWGMEFFLLTTAVLACLTSSLVLQLRKKKDGFDRGAMIGGYGYLVLHSAFIMTIVYGPK